MMKQSPFPARHRAPRLSLWLMAALLLLAVIAVLSPAQLPVVAYKAALILLAVVLGYWCDRALFPYSRPDGYLCRDWRHGTTEPENDADFRIAPGYTWPFCVAMARRALVVGAVVIGLALAL